MNLKKKKQKYIYSDIQPKKNKEEKDYSEPINEVLALEKILEKEKNNRKFDLLLNHWIIFVILRAFIYNEKIIKITNDNGNEFKVYFINFKTYEDYFDLLPKILYNDLNSDFIDLLDEKIISRESRKKGNVFLQKKKKLENWNKIFIILIY